MIRYVVTLIAIGSLLVTGLVYVKNLMIAKEKFENLYIAEQIANKANKAAIAKMKQEMEEVKAKVKYREEKLDEIKEANPEWCDTTLPFSFDSVCNKRSEGDVSTRSNSTQ